MTTRFVDELAYQHLTEEGSLTRYEVWQALRHWTSEELAKACKAARECRYSEVELAEAYTRLRLANAADLGFTYAKRAMAGDKALRYRDLTKERRLWYVLGEHHEAHVIRIQRENLEDMKREDPAIYEQMVKSFGEKELHIPSPDEIAAKYDLAVADVIEVIRQDECRRQEKMAQIRQKHMRHAKPKLVK